MKVLALDLGTTTGYAVGSPECLVSGTWAFKPSRFEGGGVRFKRFRGRLDELRDTVGFEHVVFEQVRNHKGVDAAHSHGGFLAILCEWCESQEPPIPYESVQVGTLKRFWAGHGHATKEQMIEAAKLAGYDPKDDNEADALALLYYWHAHNS